MHSVIRFVRRERQVKRLGPRSPRPGRKTPSTPPVDSGKIRAHPSSLMNRLPSTRPIRSRAVGRRTISCPVQPSPIKTTLRSFLFASLILSGGQVAGGETLDTLLQKRALDVDFPKETTLPSALSELAARYKAKYNAELPVFISVALLPDPSASRLTPATVPTIPGTDLPGAIALSPPETRLGGRLHNAPLTEILRYYANHFRVNITIRGDFILFHSSK
jgi:hypothetical protein